MLFNSFEFILFFVAVFGAYWLLPHRFRWALLLGASYFFYASAEPSYLILILASTSIDYFLCLNLTSSNEKRKRRIGLTTSILLNLGLLFTFKYFDFFQTVIHDTLWLFDVKYTVNEANFILPVGISFYTFQTLSYSIDVYRQKVQPERHFGKFALYVAFFPQLIAGPIERAQDLLSQFNKKLHLKSEEFREGCWLFSWGLFKKVVVADNTKILVDHIFDNAEFQNGGSLLFALFLFTIHIYADFSGYCDMAIGTAKMLGIKLKANFRTPYFSQSINEFWTRWHITLSQWLKDYVYIPLGGNRVSKFRHLSNLFITFFLAGLWHGASWNFVIWGLLHATLVVLEKILRIDKPSTKFLFKYTRMGIAFFVIMITMLPVRAETFNDLLDISQQLLHIRLSDLYLAVAENKLTTGVIGAVILLLTDAILARKSILEIRYKPIVLRYTWLTVIVLLILLVGDNNGDAFFYFQF